MRILYTSKVHILCLLWKGIKFLGMTHIDLVMNQNVLSDVQEVKRQLAFIGRSDIDEAVICDLLNGYPPNYALDSVMDIILSTTNDSSKKAQTTFVNEEVSNTSEIVVGKTDKETKKDNNMTEQCVDLKAVADNAIEIYDSSDSDGGVDTYYNDGDWDDISYIDNSRSYSPGILCDDIEPPAQVPNELINTDNEILEENNNDPNNNMESIEGRQEEPTCSSNNQSEAYLENTSIPPYSPQPGCSSNNPSNAYIENASIQPYSPQPGCSSNNPSDAYIENASIQPYSPQPGCSSNIESKAYTENTLIQAYSPQPGCSSNMDSEVYMENTLIPTFIPQPECSSNMESEVYTENTSIQAYSPQPGCNSNMESEASTENALVRAYSPQPGCSSNIESETYIKNTLVPAYSPEPSCTSDIERKAAIENILIRADSPEAGCSSNTESEVCTENTSMQVDSPQPGCSSNIEPEACMENTSMQVNNAQPACSSSIEHQTCMKTIPKQAYNPQACCKKDSSSEKDDFKEMRDKALKIRELLPSLGYTHILNTLLRNSRAENRIELTIWDLLPDKRPQPYYSLKRKHIDDVCIIDEIPISPKISTSKNNNSNNQDGFAASRAEPRKENFQQLFNPFNNTSKSSLFATQNKSDTSIWNNIIKQSVNTKGESNMKSVLTPVNSSLSSKDPKLRSQEIMSAECSSSVVKKDVCIPKPNILKQPIFNVISQTNMNQQATKINLIPPIKVANQPVIFNVTNCVNISNSPKNPYKIVSTKENNVKLYANIAKPDTKTGSRNKSVLIKPSRLIYATPLEQPISNSNLPTTVLSNSETPNKSCIIRVAGKPAKGINPIHLTPIATSNNMTFNLNNKSYRIVPVDPKKTNFDNSPAQKLECSVTPSTGSASQQRLPSTKIIEECLPTSSSSVSTSASKDFSCTAATKSSDVIHTLSSSEGASSAIKLNEVSSCVASQSLDKAKEHLHNTQQADKPLDPRLSQIFCNLRSMFPNGDVDYIRQICITDFENDKYISDMERMVKLTEHLLQREASTPSVEEKVPEEVAMEEQCTNLIGIFPDADPTYLRQIAQQLYNKPEELRQFIQSKLEDPNYPTREQYYAKRKITEQQKQYTIGFKVEQFLEIFPNPFEYFEDPKRQCKFDSDALEFLKFHFNRIKVATLMSCYSKNRYHLSLTVRVVELMPSEVKCKRTRVQYTPQNIPLLQEIAFIVHKTEIRNYLMAAKERELEQFRQYKMNNALLQCQCCFDDECMPPKCSSCENGHIFCNICIIRGTEAKLANGETRIGCFTDCKSEFNLSILQRILPPTKFSIILRKRQEEEVMAAGLEGLVSCPFCHFATIPPPEDKIFKCLNPDCMKETCRLCKELNHVPLKCEEAKSDKARLYLEEKMTEALVRKCYRCGRPFFKEDGCNKIYCVCGAMMCYICDKPIKGYEHFNQGNQPRSNLCPLWSDNHTINAAAVVKVAEETMKHMQERNPNVKLSTKGLLPQVPSKTNGQVQPGVNATTLPVRAFKIAKFDL